MKLPNTSKQYAATCPIPHSVACQKHPPPHRPLLKYWSLTPWMARMNCQGIRLGDRGHSQNHAGSYWTCVDDHSFVWWFSHGLVHSKEIWAISTNRCKPTKQVWGCTVTSTHAIGLWGPFSRIPVSRLTCHVDPPMRHHVPSCAIS